MSAAVSRRRIPGYAQRVQIVFPGRGAAPGLLHDCALGAGVRVRVDAARPGRWQAIWVDAWDERARMLLEALIGAAAVQRIDGRLGAAGAPGRDLYWMDFDRADQHPDGPGPAAAGWGEDVPQTHSVSPSAADLRAAQPWLRLAAVDALDRWLHLPLNQALVDAERGVTRGRAAATLEPGPARDEILGDALRLARAASWGVVEYLGRLARSPRPVPESLRKVLSELIEGYQALITAIPEPDGQLRQVVRAGRGVLDRLRAGLDKHCPHAPGVPQPGPQAAGTASPGTVMTSLIDPRQVPARILRLLADPAAGEISMQVTQANGRDAVVVEVPAYGAGDGELRGGSAADRLAVRLIDTGTGADLDGALLTLERGTAHAPPAFRAIVPGPGHDLSRLRADVYDGASDEPPAASDADPDLLSVRRATTALATWRCRAAVRRLGGSPPAAAPAPAGSTEPPAFLASAARRPVTTGAGDLLAAELDAASGLIGP
jgi:hypothetical protein